MSIFNRIGIRPRRFTCLIAVTAICFASAAGEADTGLGSVPAPINPAASQPAQNASAYFFADQLPPTTLAYYGWSGQAQKLQGTKLALMLADDRLMKPLLKRIQLDLLGMPDDVGGDKISENLPKMLDDMGRGGGCIALMEINPRKKAFNPQAILVLNLGERRKAFEAEFQPIQSRLKERLGESMKLMKVGDSWFYNKTTRGQIQYSWGFLGNTFMFLWGDNAPQMLQHLNDPQHRERATLLDAPNFRDNLAKISGEPILASYIDTALLREAVPMMVRSSDGPDIDAMTRNMPKVLQALGLDNAKAIVSKTMVQDEQFLTRSLICTDGPPRGLISQLITHAVDDEILKAVPEDAMFAAAIRLDPAKAFDQIKAAAISVGGDDAVKAFEALEAGGWAMGLAPKQGLAPLGDQWVMYSAASTGGSAILGWTLVGAAKDAKQLQGAIETLRRILSSTFGNDSNASVIDETVDGVVIHCLQMGRFSAPICPAWAVTNDRIVVALYPQLVEDALRQLKNSKSVLDNPEFIAARNRTGRDGPLFYSSNDQIVRSLYTFAPIFVAAYYEFSRAFDPGDRGHQDPSDGLFILPSLQRLLQYVGVDGLCVTITPNGILSTRSQANPVLSPLAVGDILPWIFAATANLRADSSDRLASAGNLRQIGQGCVLYANENNNAFPPDLETMIKAENLSADVLKSPFGEANNGPAYVYIHSDAPQLADVVIAYDQAELDQEEGANVLYGDGHVDYLDADDLKAALDKSQKRQKEHPAENPAIKNKN